MFRTAPSRRSTLLVAAVALALGTLAHAQPDERGRGGARGGEHRRGQQGDARGGERPWGPPGGRGWRDARPLERQPQPPWSPPPAVQAPPPVDAPPYQPQLRQPPGQGRVVERRWAPQAPRLHSGDPLPPEYRQRQYLVNDWRAHRLYAPPPGHQWVQPEPGSYLLIGRNGEIVNMLVGQ